MFHFVLLWLCVWLYTSLWSLQCVLSQWSYRSLVLIYQHYHLLGISWENYHLVVVLYRCVCRWKPQLCLQVLVWYVNRSRWRLNQRRRPLLETGKATLTTLQQNGRYVEIISGENMFYFVAEAPIENESIHIIASHLFGVAQFTVHNSRVSCQKGPICHA